MTFDYEQVCKLLSETIPLTNSPTFEINPNGRCDEQFFGKIRRRYECWPKSKRAKPPKKDLSCIGSCDIDNLNGNEIFRLFFNICENKTINYADFFCLSANGKTCGALYFNHDRFYIVTLLPPDDNNLKNVYTQLFDDKQVQKNKRKEYKYNPNDEDLQLLRQKAKVEFPKFLKTKFSQFDLHPFGVAFLGVAFDIANHSSSKYFVNSSFLDLKSIPFAACVKLAFDYDQTGKVTQLFGEIGGTGTFPKELVPERKATLSWNTARNLINNIADEKGEFQNNKVLEVAQEIKQVFQIDDVETTS